MPTIVQVDVFNSLGRVVASTRWQLMDVERADPEDEAWIRAAAIQLAQQDGQLAPGEPASCTIREGAPHH